MVLRDVEINDDGRVDLSEGGLSWQADVPRHSIPLMFSFPTQHIPSSPPTKAKAYPHLQKQIPTEPKASPHLQKHYSESIYQPKEVYSHNSKNISVLEKVGIKDRINRALL